jgi:hypothetical protein
MRRSGCLPRQSVDGLARLDEDFAGDGVHDRIRRNVVANPRADSEFLIKLIATDARQYHTLVKEQRV